ncbi:MAG TPA: ATP-dependent DNA helicase [Candidatus Saccharimonadales bacterium]
MQSEAFAVNRATLNAAQKQAVDTIEGPVLVIAGPGTGKTQLLSLRVANILDRTDTLPQNILCLTFTESGAANMRERLTRFIGKAAYDVQIATYHTFGSDLIRQFPEYFTETNLERPIDELGKYQIIEAIVDNMSYLNPLKQTRHHLGDVMSTISEIKRALLTPADLRGIIAENQAFIKAAQPFIAEVFANFGRMPSKLPAAMAFFTPLLAIFKTLLPQKPVSIQFAPLASLALDSLTKAIHAAESSNSTKPLTEWKNKWLAKNSENQFIIKGELENRRITALADALEAYQSALEQGGFYDFDDMILRSIHALEENAELKFSLQERYLYLLLDEFQDTNAAQLKLVQLLTDNPVNEGRPNVLAVGDDDQAIYAFQGAQYSNMLDFYQMYRDVKAIHLTRNYRSATDILHVAHNVVEQIEARLHHHFSGMNKLLHAANASLKAHVARHEFLSEIAEADWIAHEIKKMIDAGTSPSEIAVLAPKHKYLEPLVPYLNALNIPVRYEKRENILEAPAIAELTAMSKLVLSLAENDETQANALWPQVLSFGFWHIPTSTIWKLSWAINKRRGELSWSQALLEAENLKQPALLFLTLANKASTESLEVMLDHLTGTTEVTTNEPDVPAVRSPFKSFYTKKTTAEESDTFYHTLSHLSVLRAKLREYQTASDHTLTLIDLLQFIHTYNAAGQQLINTSPYAQAADAVELMTVYKAKGLEFEHVFLPSCHDDVWGESSRGQMNKLTLPPNLMPIRHAGAAPDERLRLFFVAITRAKRGLYLTSYLQTFSGKHTKRLKYLDEQEAEDGSFKAATLPAGAQTVTHSAHEAPPQKTLELSWQTPHLASLDHTAQRALIQNEYLQNYRLSPTHVNNFIDLEHGGPEDFFLYNILRFPKAETTSALFGNAIHETLEWVQHQLNARGNVPVIAAITAHFEACLNQKPLSADSRANELERGKHALESYFAHRSQHFLPGDQAEKNFAGEAVFLGAAHLGGKIDKLHIDKARKTITVTDYKTGASHNRWESNVRLHKYRQQLYCYKIIIENSRSFRGYSVEKGILEFIEPDHTGAINTLELTFTAAELEHTKMLLQAVWKIVQQLEFPDTSSYPPTLTGIKQFESDLLKNLGIDSI